MLPSDIVTVPVTWSDGQNHAGDQLITSISFTPSQTVIHAASGIPLINVTWGDLSRGRIDLPAVDQEGFIDDQGDQVSGWHYLAAITYRSGGQVRVVEKRFQPLTGQTGIDIDLLPAQNPVDPPVIVVRGVSSVGNGRTGDVTSAVLAGDILPFLPSVDVGVTSFNGQTGDVVADATSLGADVVGSASTAEANAKDYADGLISALPEITPGTQSALDLKADLVGGKVPESQLPSFVDDVLEFPSENDFPATGESGKVYIASDTNQTYRWTGGGYARLSEGVVLGETASTAYRGDRGKTAYDHTLLTDNPHNVTKAQVGLGAVENIAPADLPVSSATASALAGKASTGDVTTLQANTVRVVTHGGNASMARPTGVGAVLWVGSATPANRVAGDVWVEVP